jgi:hypothetical protein
MIWHRLTMFCSAVVWLLVSVVYPVICGDWSEHFDVLLFRSAVGISHHTNVLISEFTGRQLVAVRYSASPEG